MTIPLTPIGGAALGALAWRALRELPPGQFLRELWNGPPAASAPVPAASTGPSDTRPKPLPDLSADLRANLRAAGIALAEPVVLATDGHGTIVVEGAHLERDAIERALASDPALQAELVKFAAAATREHDAQAKLFGSSFAEFRLRLGADSASVYFE